MRPTNVDRLCFVIMPFTEHLHYFYLAIKYHVERDFGVKCERADEQVLSIPILDKIRDYILRADGIIADLSGRSANVFYELGMAHVYGKDVILITSDEESPPSDVRHFEYIRYALGEHEAFFQRLDNALRNVLFQRYEALHERARVILADFRKDTRLAVGEAGKEEFLKRVMVAERTTVLPSLENLFATAEFVLPRIVADPSDVGVMSAITRWIADLGERMSLRQATP
jgi:hypothetical protein